jgi:Rha family phage regulatory protein
MRRDAILQKPETSGPDSALVRIACGLPTTTSVVIAEKFGKRHDAVLRSIRNLETPDSFNAHNFVAVEYRDVKGELRPMFSIARDGFAVLAMGFTGKKAAEWKVKFLEAFNWQANEINRLRNLHCQPEWRAARIEGKAARRDETDVIKSFVDYAKSQGSKSADRYYQVITKETNRALFFVQSAVDKGFRDSLTSAQLSSVAMAERIVERALLEAMGARMFYRDAYRLAADRVRQFAGFVGKSIPGKTTSLLEAA